jgi:hypothetical protein
VPRSQRPGLDPRLFPGVTHLRASRSGSDHLLDGRAYRDLPFHLAHRDLGRAV